jgi:oxygen-dependent protoporphyrinogen oxidase
VNVAVVGGGIGGLTAAWRLIQAGHEVSLLEQRARLGGVIDTVNEDGFRRELAANGFLSGAADGAAALCEELGVPVVTAAPAAKRRWVYLRGRLHPLPGGPTAFARSGLLTWRGKLELLGEPWRPARDTRVAGDQSLWDFAVRRFGTEVAHALIAPMVTGVFAADAHEVSLAGGFPRLAALDARGGMVRGLIAEARARRKAGQSRRPNRLSAPTGGMIALVDALTARLGARVQCGVNVRELRPVGRGGNPSGVEVATDVGVTHYDAAVLALPAPQAAIVVRQALPALGRGLDDAGFSAAAVVSLGFAARDIRVDLGGFGFIVAAGEAPRLLGCVFESTVWSERAPVGQVLLRLIYGGSRDPGAVGLDDPALFAQARADLAQILGVRAAPTLARVTRWSQGIAHYAVGHVERVAAWERVAHPARIVLAGSSYHGIAVNDCVADARRVVRQVAAWT